MEFIGKFDKLPVEKLNQLDRIEFISLNNSCLIGLLILTVFVSTSAILSALNSFMFIPILFLCAFLFFRLNKIRNGIIKHFFEIKTKQKNK